MKKITSFLLLISLLFCCGCDLGLVTDNSSDGSKVSDSASSAISQTAESSVLSEASSQAEESSEPAVSIDPYNVPNDIQYYIDMSVKQSDYDTYFNNSCFVGNSIMLHFLNYTTAKRSKISYFLGNAKFLCAASFGANNNKTKAVLPKYKDTEYTIQDGVKAMGVKTVYISLMALNDIALFEAGEGARETYNLMVEIIDAIKAQTPDVNIVILSNTYLNYATNTWKKLNNGSISELNNLMLEYCNTNGLDFIDLSTVLLDDKNCLADDFCNDLQDTGCHLTTYAYNAWITVLREYSRLKQADAWQNPTSMAVLTKNS